MANYKQMYAHLFKEMTKAIEILQRAQQKCEEMYIEGEEEICVMHIEREDETT